MHTRVISERIAHIQLENVAMMSGMDWGWGGMIFGPFMMIVFIAVVVVVIVLFVRGLGGPGIGGALHNSAGKVPLDILKERFAKGEIDQEEFEERRRALGE
jgi:putative membrane protein